ncbi:hypothetical protein [Parasitella parasitica]|uniref:Uncharacterized protein n=1 Tax=Parasitella parasitica TaxID=35722 RepID=A0A0B7NN81_9FUNG|nr:hypothetical protein [Parasitella parasitica]
MHNHSHYHHGPQKQQQSLPSLHHLMLPSPPSNYHGKHLSQPQPQASHSYPVNTSSYHYSSQPPKIPRMEFLDYFDPMDLLPSDDHILNDISMFFFGADYSNMIPYQSSFIPPSPASPIPPYNDFTLFDPLEQRHSSTLSCKGKLIPDLNASSFSSFY